MSDNRNSVIVGVKPMNSYMMAIFRMSKVADSIAILARGQNIPKALKLALNSIDSLPDKWNKGQITYGVTQMPYKPIPGQTPINPPPEKVNVIEISITINKAPASGGKGGRGVTSQ